MVDQSARLHLLEANGECAFDDARLDGLSGQPQRGRATRAVVVDVDNRNSGHTRAVDGALATRRIPVHVAGVGLPDLVESDSGVRECVDNGLRAHLVVVLAAPWLRERDHSDPGD